MSAPSTPSDAELWISRAHELRLAEDRYWRLLLHHEPSPFGSGSGIRNSIFFLTRTGAKDASAELDSTLRALAQSPSADHDRDVRCRFPLRTTWLGERLGLPADRVKLDCPKYSQWRRTINVDSVTLIFASAYLNNPSSMYGHTFLRLDQKGREDKDRLLNYSVNFAANADTNNGLLFAVYGLTGRFPAGFSAMPYYLKVQEYSNFESRDLWEYRLNLDASAVDRLAAHIWELDGAEFSYYFFNRNCSYQLLPLLEIADPRLHLSDHWPAYVLPIDTIRALLRQPGLVGKATYRPSRTTLLLWRRSRLDSEEVTLAGEITRSSESATWSRLSALPPPRQALVLDSAADYLTHLADFRPAKEAEYKDAMRRVLVRRGRLELPPAPGDPPTPTPPTDGHDSARAGIGYGFGDRHFLEADIRVALHDLLDPSAGYVHDSDMEMLRFTLRHDFAADRNYLERGTLARILSISPYDPWVRHPSWEVDTGWRTAEELDPRPWKAGYYGLTVGTGLAYETHFWRREVAYALAEGDGGAGGIFHHDFRLGAGGTAAWHAELSKTVSLRLEAGDRAYFGDARAVPRESAEASWTILRDLSARIRFSRAKKYDESAVNVYLYF